MKTLKEARRWLQDYFLRRKTSALVHQLDNALNRIKGRIPVIIVSHNNAVYVENMVQQLAMFGIRPIVIDNASKGDSLQKLDTIKRSGSAEIVFSDHNWGHKVGFLAPIYEKLPPVFAYTDPDLQLNGCLPENFLDILESLTECYRVYKAGFALDLLADMPIVNATNSAYGDVRTWEAQYWRKPLIHKNLEVWAAEIDTTFAVYNKRYDRKRFFDAVRVSREFSAIHLPWFPDLDLFTITQRVAYTSNNNSSTWISS